MFVNLTPHVLSVKLADGGFLAIPPDGRIARVSVTRAPIDNVGGVCIYQTRFGDVIGLPEPEPNTKLIVSALVKIHPSLQGRGDVFSPGSLIRDPEGKPIGCDGLDAR